MFRWMVVAGLLVGCGGGGAESRTWDADTPEERGDRFLDDVAYVQDLSTECYDPNGAQQGHLVGLWESGPSDACRWCEDAEFPNMPSTDACGQMVTACAGFVDLHGDDNCMEAHLGMWDEQH